MLKTIEKHKIFILLILALLTLATGFLFVNGKEAKDSGASTARFYIYFKASWANSKYSGPGDYKNSAGYSYYLDIGTVCMTVTLSDHKYDQYKHDGGCDPKTLLENGSVSYYNDAEEETEKYKVITLNNEGLFAHAKYKLTFSVTLTPGDGFELANYGWATRTIVPGTNLVSYSITESGSTSKESSGENGWGYSDVSENIEYLAIFRPSTFNLTYDANGGTFSDGKTTKSGSVTCYEKCDYPTPTRTGYEFVGWGETRTSTSNVTIYCPSETSGGRGFSKKYSTVYAIWRYKPLVSFDGNKGSGSTSPSGIPSARRISIYDYYTTITPPTRSGYTFNGFYTAASGGTQIYKNDGKAVTSNRLYDYGLTSDHTLYAQWTPIEYTISFDRNQGSGGTASTNVKFDATYPNITVPTRTGYTFLGYYTSASGGTQIYNSSGTSTTKYTTVGNSTLYARWQANTYTITFDQQNGSGGTTQINATYDATYPSITVPTRTGYTFLGYYTSASGGTQIYNSSGTSTTKYTTAGASTLYARWQANTYNVIIDYANLPNLLSDVSMELSGWGGTKVSTYAHSGSYSRKIVGYSGQPETLMNSANTVQMKQNHIYYISVHAYQDELTSGGSVECYWPVLGGNSTGSIGLKPAKQWNLYSWRVQRTYGTGDYTFRFDFNNNGVAGEIYFDSAKVYDLTDAFGAGNEPSKEWCDLHLSGMKSVNVTYGAGLPSISIPLKTGYTFEGAYYESTGEKYIAANGTRLISNWSIASDVTLNCHWEENWINKKSSTVVGSGTASSPYKISSAGDLAWLAYQVNHGNLSSQYAYVEQQGNIDLAGTTWFPIGSSSKPFKGVYNGKGYTISNLNTTTIVKDDGKNIYDVVGLFGKIQGGSTIKNVILLSGNIYGAYDVGSFAGSLSSSTITNCTSYVNVYCSGEAGGFVGWCSSSTITNCYYKGTVQGSGSSIGGIVGVASASTIKSCMYEGDQSFVGGKSTGTSSTIEDCVIISTKNVAFSGDGSATIKNCLMNGANKYYYGNTNNFANWVITTTKTPLPSGLAWVATGGNKVTSINQIIDLGYTAG